MPNEIINEKNICQSLSGFNTKVLKAIKVACIGDNHVHENIKNAGITIKDIKNKVQYPDNF